MHCSSGRTRAPQDHWPLVISIATRYGFDEIREKAIHGISSLVPPVDPVRLVELALHYDVSQWLEGAYISLCVRPNPLTLPEAARVGHAIAKKIGRCRAEFIMTNPGASIGRTPSDNKELAREIVRIVFWPYGPVPRECFVSNPSSMSRHRAVRFRHTQVIFLRFRLI